MVRSVRPTESEWGYSWRERSVHCHSPHSPHPLSSNTGAGASTPTNCDCQVMETTAVICDLSCSVCVLSSVNSVTSCKLWNSMCVNELAEIWYHNSLNIIMILWSYALSHTAQPTTGYLLVKQKHGSVSYQLSDNKNFCLLSKFLNNWELLVLILEDKDKRNQLKPNVQLELHKVNLAA